MSTLSFAKVLALIGWGVTLGWFASACASSTADAPVLPTQVPRSLASPGSSQTIAPTPVVQENVPLKEFVHDSNRFSIQFPETWQSFESEDGAVFFEPGDRAGISVFFDDVQDTYTTDDLNLYLTNYLLHNFLNKETHFRPISQDTRPNHVVVAQFSSTNDARGETMNELRVLQQDTIVFLVLLNATLEQWDVSADRLRELADTFTPQDTNSRPSDPAEDAKAPIWVLVGPESKAFGFFRASDWEIKRQEENLVAVDHEETGMTFTAAKFSWPNAAIEAKASEMAALAEAQALTELHSDLEHLPPQPFPLAGEQGATIDFLYTSADGTKIAGSVVTAVHQGQMFKIIFTAPADIYEAALEWFNPMLRSFNFLSPEEIPLEELQTQ